MECTVDSSWLVESEGVSLSIGLGWCWPGIVSRGNSIRNMKCSLNKKVFIAMKDGPVFQRALLQPTPPLCVPAV